MVSIANQSVDFSNTTKYLKKKYNKRLNNLPKIENNQLDTSMDVGLLNLPENIKFSALFVSEWKAEQGDNSWKYSSIWYLIVLGIPPKSALRFNLWRDFLRT